MSVFNGPQPLCDLTTVEVCGVNMANFEDKDCICHHQGRSYGFTTTTIRGVHTSMDSGELTSHMNPPLFGRGEKIA